MLTGPYLVSGATFPTYFLKNRDRVEQIHCQLDIEFFARYFAPAFSVSARYVGTEPLSEMTNQYNEIMKSQLSRHGIEIVGIPRLSIKDTPISASTVRNALKNRELQTVQTLVAPTTLAYLTEKHLI